MILLHIASRPTTETAIDWAVNDVTSAADAPTVSVTSRQVLAWKKPLDKLVLFRKKRFPDTSQTKE